MITLTRKRCSVPRIAGRGTRMDASVRAGLQRTAPAQWHPVCHASGPSSRRRPRAPGTPERRNAVYQLAKQRHPQRWSGHTRNWEVTGPVSLNPEKMHEIERNQQAA